MSDEMLRRERDLYRRLLDLDGQRELGPLLREALALVVDATGARLGYLERHDDHAGDDGPRWSAAHGMSGVEIATARTVMSRGIIGEALAIACSCGRAPRATRRSRSRAGSGARGPTVRSSN